MMGDIVANLSIGFAVALAPVNLLYCFAGALIGTLIGILPGLGVTATIAMLLPLTFHVPKEASLIMLAGIYYGAQYGGSTTAILVNLPGESSSVITCLDGNRMARDGRGGSALAIAALGSLFAGLVATLIVAAFAPVLVRLALHFGPAEYFGLMLLGLIAATALSDARLVKALAMVCLGLLLGLVGTEVASGTHRMTLGFAELTDGISFVALAVGLFAIPEVLRALDASTSGNANTAKLGRLWPTREEARRASPAVLRGTAIGSVLGILPGGGALLASFMAYAVEKHISRRPDTFGKGAVEGVAAPEAANNAGAQTSFIPLLTLGLPSNAVMALLAGAMVIQGIRPGPDVIQSQPALFWGLVASMLIGNVMLVVINLPLIPIWLRLLNVPYRFLFPAIVTFCLIGVYSVSNSLFDVGVMVACGALGYALQTWSCPPAPLVLAFIIAPLVEEHFQRALMLSRGDFSIFLASPLSIGFLAAAMVLVLVMCIPRFNRGRTVILKE